VDLFQEDDMTRSQRLHRVAGQVEKEQDAASRRLSELRSLLSREEGQLEALREHLSSYRNGMAELHRSGSVAHQLQNYARFTEKLHDAVQTQEKRVVEVRQAYDRQLVAWNEQRMRVKAVEKAAQRHENEEKRRAERSEQRHLDDLVTRRFIQGAD
jgi:flagellar protein FliJ